MLVLELKYLVKWKGCPDGKSSWELVAHLGDSKELVEEFHLSNPNKLNQVTLPQALQEATEKQARYKTRVEAA
jgi:hypothetical protein